jgi:SAM-dependent methyltransferase
VSEGFEVERDRSRAAMNEHTTIAPHGFWIGPAADLPHAESPALAYWIARLLRGRESEPIRDLGCGIGYYLRILKEQGFSDLTGYEGSPPEPRDFEHVIAQDITEPFNGLGDPGHVLCLEVLEHVPADLESGVLENIANLCGEGSLLIASWAVRGQTGLGHVNERDNFEAITRIQAHGFRLLEDETRAARGLDHGSSWWFPGSLLVFERCEDRKSP